MNEQAFRAELAREGFEEVVLRDYAAGYHMAEHSHPFHARALITQGEFTLIVAGDKRTYAVGDVFDLPAGCPHDESAGPQGARYVVGRRSAA